MLLTAEPSFQAPKSRGIFMPHIYLLLFGVFYHKEFVLAILVCLRIPRERVLLYTKVLAPFSRSLQGQELGAGKGLGPSRKVKWEGICLQDVAVVEGVPSLMAVRLVFQLLLCCWLQTLYFLARLTVPTCKPGRQWVSSNT